MHSFLTVSVDGIQIGGTQTATSLHGIGTQEFDVYGNFAAGSHAVTVNFVNATSDASGSRNLYMDSAAIDGTVVPGAALTENTAGPQSFDRCADINDARNGRKRPPPLNL